MDWQMSVQMQHEAKPEINKMGLYQTHKKCLCNYSTLLSLKQFFEPDHCWPSEGCKGKDKKKVWSKWIYIYSLGGKTRWHTKNLFSQLKAHCGLKINHLCCKIWIYLMRHWLFSIFPLPAPVEKGD